MIKSSHWWRWNQFVFSCLHKKGKSGWLSACWLVGSLWLNWSSVHLVKHGKNHVKGKNKLSGGLCATAHYWHQSAFQQWLQRIKGPCRFQPFLDLHRNPVYWSPSVIHSGIRLFPLRWPLTLCPYKHHALLPSVNETLSQRSFKVFTLAADLCSARCAMSRRSVSNLNTTLQWSWLWPMYGTSVYPAPISLTGPRRSRAFAPPGSTGCERGRCPMEDEQALKLPCVGWRILGMD